MMMLYKYFTPLPPTLPYPIFEKIEESNIQISNFTQKNFKSFKYTFKLLIFEAPPRDEG